MNQCLVLIGKINIKQWPEMSKGGHFAALEKLELLIKD